MVAAWEADFTAAAWEADTISLAKLGFLDNAKQEQANIGMIFRFKGDQRSFDPP